MAVNNDDGNNGVTTTPSTQSTERRHGKWIILGDLGSGGFSIVKTALDTTTGEHVALKFLKPDKITDSKQVVREVEHMMKINHPNVLRLKEVIWDTSFTRSDGSRMRTHLIALELAPGGELFALLNTTGPFSEPLARTYFRQLVEGLDACHRVGIAHRDLKPENILMGANFSLKIADFGLSRTFDTDSLLYTGGGTSMYQPPEFGSAGYDGVKVDNWAAGVILFMMLAGFPPYSDKGPRDWWYDKLVTGRLDLFWMAHERQHVFTPQAKDLINNLLNPDPIHRFSLDQVRKHTWYLGETIRPDALIPEMINRRRAVEAKRALEPSLGLPSGDGKSNTTRPLGGIYSQQSGGGTTQGTMQGQTYAGTTTGMGSQDGRTHVEPDQHEPMMTTSSSTGYGRAVGVISSPQALPQVSQPAMWGSVDSRKLDSSDAAYDSAESPSSSSLASKDIKPATISFPSLSGINEEPLSRASSDVPHIVTDGECHAYDEASFSRLAIGGEGEKPVIPSMQSTSSVGSVTGEPIAPSTPACYTTCADLIACHTKFISSFPARDLLHKLTTRLRHWGAKYEVNESYFRIRAKVLCTGAVLSFTIQVWKSPDLLKAPPAAFQKYLTAHGLNAKISPSPSSTGSTGSTGSASSTGSKGSDNSSSSAPATDSPVSHSDATLHKEVAAVAATGKCDLTTLLSTVSVHAPLPEGARHRYLVQFRRRAGPLGGFCQIFKDLREELSDPNDPCTVKMAAMEAARAHLGTESHTDVVAHKRALLALPNGTFQVAAH